MAQHTNINTFDFDNDGYCKNPNIEFSFNGKYITARIVSAIINFEAQVGYVFGTYFRGACSYVNEPCKNSNTPVAITTKEDKNREIALRLKSGIDYFEGIKLAEVQSIEKSKWAGNNETKIQDTYDKEISTLKTKMSECLQLNIF